MVFRGIDGYDDSIPFTRAMQDDVMLAFLMNGEKLPKEHGFPIRLLVPGLYGIKNVKWIVEIEVYPGDYHGYWQRKGWTDDGTIKIFSRIDSPWPLSSIARPRAAIPRHRLRRTKLHQQSGNQFRCRPERGMTCEIETPMSPYSWVIWNYTWRPPKRGKYQVAVRATDTKGQLQIAEIIRPQPAGASGLHTIIADVESVG